MAQTQQKKKTTAAKTPQDRRRKRPTKAQIAKDAAHREMTAEFLQEVEAHNQAVAQHEELGRIVERRKGRIGYLQEKLTQEFGGLHQQVIQAQDQPAPEPQE